MSVLKYNCGEVEFLSLVIGEIRACWSFNFPNNSEHSDLISSSIDGNTTLVFISNAEYPVIVKSNGLI